MTELKHEENSCIVLLLVLALDMVMLVHLWFQTQTIKRDYAEMEQNHLYLKSQIKCAERVLQLLEEVSKAGCIISEEDPKELEGLNCKKDRV